MHVSDASGKITMKLLAKGDELDRSMVCHAFHVKKIISMLLLIFVLNFITSSLVDHWSWSHSLFIRTHLPLELASFHNHTQVWI